MSCVYIIAKALTENGTGVSAFGVWVESSFSASSGEMQYMFNPFLAPACKISGLKGERTHACKRYILTVLYENYFQYCAFGHKSLDINPFTRLRKGGRGLKDFTFGTFTGRSRSDGAASMAVKGLIMHARISKEMGVTHGWSQMADYLLHTCFR